MNIHSAIPNLKFCEQDEYLAFLFHTVQKLLNPIYQQLLEAFDEYQTFFNDLHALTRFMNFNSWDDLFHFMEEGLKLASIPP